MKKILARLKSLREPYTNSIEKANGKIWRAALLVILLYCYVAILFTPPVLAAPLDANSINLHSWTQISTLDIASGLTCQIAGYDPTNPQGAGCVLYNQTGQLEVMDKSGGGAVAFAGNLIAALYTNPPASGIQYLADLGKNLGIVKPAYAQGIGFKGLEPILPLWKAFRNIAYLFFTIVFIVIGFAIMFRVKISPQAVMTIQSALPRIVMALILVTFSYAIAGFLIDLMYVSISLFIFMLGVAGDGIIKNPSIVQRYYLTGGLPSLAGAVFSGGFRALDDLVKGFWAPGLISLSVPAIIGGIISGNPLGLSVGVIGGVLILLIFSLILLWTLIKLFLMLLTSYIQIIVSIIFAPLQLMLGAIPGQDSFGGWLRNLLANIAVFPAVAAMLLIGTILTTANTTQGLWTPPMLGLAGGVATATQGLIGLGIILLTPKVAEMVKEALKLKPFKYGAAIGEATGVITQPIRGMAGGAIQGYAETFPKAPIVGGVVSSIGRMVGGGKRG